MKHKVATVLNGRYTQQYINLGPRKYWPSPSGRIGSPSKRAWKKYVRGDVIA